MLYLEHTLNSFSSKVKTEASKANSTNGHALNKLLHDGAIIISLCEQAEQLLGPITLTLYFLHLILSACGIFFATSLPQGLLSKHYLLIAHGICNLLMSICSIYILYNLQRAGQKLCDSFARVNKSLHGLYICEADILSIKQKAKFDILMVRYSNIAPMRPMDVFNLNRASGFSIGGLLLTYIIVLLQFKTGEG